jgi:hypothetical protein
MGYFNLPRGIYSCEVIQLQYSLVRIDGATEARGTNIIEMTGLVGERKIR